MRLGQHWLTDAQAAQLADLARLRMIFAGRHRELFYGQGRTQHLFRAVGQNASRVLYLCLNLAGRCSLKYGDFLFGEPLAVQPADGDPYAAAAVDRLIAASKLHALLYDSAVVSSWAGRAYVQVVLDAGTVRVERLEPETVFDCRYGAADRLISASVRRVMRIGDASYLHVADHSAGHIAHELWLLDGSGAIKASAPLDLLRPGLGPLEETGVDEPLVIELPNYATGGLGASDYADGESLIDEINNRLSQISGILDRHGDPVFKALRSLFDENGNLRIAGGGKAVIVEDGSTQDPISALTWDSKLGDAGSALVSARDAFLLHMEMAPVLLGLGGGNTSADTWKKFRLAASPTLARVKRKITFVEPGIQAIFRVAGKMENRWTPYGYPLGPLKLTWSDGLPTDQSELAQTISTYRNAGVMSRRMALTWIHGERAVVDGELAELAAEDQATLPTALRGGAADLADTSGGDIAQDGPQSPRNGEESQAGASGG